MSEWAESVDMLIDAIEPGDEIELEYETRQRTTSQKTGVVEDVLDLEYNPHIVARFGSDHPWKVGRSVSVEYDHARDGSQTRHLGRVKRIRVV